MAPIGEMANTSDRPRGDLGEQNIEDEKGNLWSSILSEVQSSSSTKLPAHKSVLVLGDNESGKTTLIAKLQGNEDPKKGSGLEFMYVNVKDEYGDGGYFVPWIRVDRPDDPVVVNQPQRSVDRPDDPVVASQSNETKRYPVTLPHLERLTVFKVILDCVGQSPVTGEGNQLVIIVCSSIRCREGIPLRNIKTSSVSKLTKFFTSTFTDHTRLGVWVLDGDLHHTSLLRFALTEENFAHTLVLLVVSMAHPWHIMESLHRWSEVLAKHVNRLKIKPQDRREYEESLVRQFQEYVEPEEGVPSSVPRRGGPNPLHPMPSKAGEEKVLLPLGETTLTHNLGIPVVVVVTKSDAISTLEKEHDYKEEYFDFIQQYIRKFSLNYGGGLFYTSVKEEKNCDLLYKYLIHRIYGFSFLTSAYVVEKDSVFVPAGWDNEKKISILYENMSNMKPDDSYEDVIVKPSTRKVMQRDAELLAEDEQAFLLKLQIQMTKQPASGQRVAGESPLRPGAQRQTPSPRIPSPASVGVTAAASPSKKGDGTKVAANEGVLANFFNSLLSKKPGTPAPAKGSDRGSVSREPMGELDRLTRTKKNVTSGHPPNNKTS